MGQIYMAGPWITEHEVRMVEDAMRNGWYEHAYGLLRDIREGIRPVPQSQVRSHDAKLHVCHHLLLSGLGIKDGE